MEKINALLYFGTRPEIIKLWPVYNQLKKRKHKVAICYSNQHSQALMKDSIFQDLPFNCDEITEKQIKDGKFTHLIVQGDTWSALRGAILAKKYNIPLVHVEAGLRSYDERMVEEKIRILIDEIADYKFCTTISAADNCNGIEVGNTLFESMELFTYPYLTSEKYAILTLHRPENVDNPAVLEDILAQVSNLDIPVYFFVHPRTKDKIKETYANILYMSPVSFSEMLSYERQAEYILTDSGGMQEEAMFLHKPCITLRETTERPETIESGWNILWGHNLPMTLKMIMAADKGDFYTEKAVTPSEEIVKYMENL